jgi:hypothetical protein
LRSRLYSIALLFLLVLHAQGQDWQLLSEFDLKAKVHRVSSDNYKSVLITDINGTLYKYDSTGKPINVYSPPKRSKVTLLEGDRTMNIFLFYENFQEYVFLDRFFNQTQPLPLPRERVGFARVATVALDNNIWLFDDLDFSLKKFNTQFQNIDITTPLNLILDATEYEITFLREYQNQLFIADKNSGILVFDNLGNYKTKLPFMNVNWFGFLNDQIYFIQNEELVVYNLYSYKEQRFSLPIKAEYILLYDQKAFIPVGAKMQVYKVSLHK